MELNWAEGLPVRVADMFIGLYQPSPETAGFWEGVKRHELLLKHCPHCGKLHHPRRILCSGCGESGLGWQRAGGKGTVYSMSEVHRTTGEFSPSTPYVVGICELAEGVHMFTRFLPRQGEPDNAAIRIGVPVQLEFQVLEQGMLLPVFRVA